MTTLCFALCSSYVARCCYPKSAILRSIGVRLCFKTHFKGFELQGVEMSLMPFLFFLFLCTFAIYLHLSVQLSFCLHTMLTQRKRYIFIGGVHYKRQVRVVMGVISVRQFLLGWVIDMLEITLHLLACNMLSSQRTVVPYPGDDDRFMPALSSSRVQSTPHRKNCQYSSCSKISVDLCSRILFQIK